MDYQDLKPKVKALLTDLALHGGLTMTQEQVCNQFDLDYRSPFLKMALYEASVESWRESGVLLSALVINSVTGLPDSSFFALCEELGRRPMRKNDMWERELARINECFQDRVPA